MSAPAKSTHTAASWLLDLEHRLRRIATTGRPEDGPPDEYCEAEAIAEVLRQRNDLLAALRTMLVVGQGYLDLAALANADTTSGRKAMDRAREALAKAEGGQP